MAFLAFDTGRPFFDNNGNLLVGGKLRIYDATTTSYKTVYQDADETVPWANNASTQITFDSAGRLEQPVYVGSGAWKFTLEDANEVVFVTQDNIPGETVLTTSSFARPNMPVLSKSLSYTVLQDDIGSMIQADPTGGDVTITLISAVTAGDGAQIGVQHVGSAGKVIVAVPGGQTVNGASTVTIRVPRSGAVFTSNAGVWSGPVTSAPFATLSKTTTYTVGVVDHGKTIKADATGGAFTITLPAATDAGDGFEITVVKIDAANTVTVDGDGSETINGSANFSLSRQWQAVTIRCNGTGWEALTAPRATPASSTDNAVARYDGTSGLLQNSGVTIDDSNNVAGVGTLAVSGQITSTNTGADKLASGTTAQRPSGTAGMMRWNSTRSRQEVYTGSVWAAVHSWDFVSSETTVSSSVDSATSIAHGLGVVPSRLEVRLRCKTADLGYSVGDEVVMPGLSVSGGVFVTIAVDSTNINISVDAGPISIANKGGTDRTSITAGSWRWVAMASY